MRTIPIYRENNGNYYKIFPDGSYIAIEFDEMFRKTSIIRYESDFTAKIDFMKKPYRVISKSVFKKVFRKLVVELNKFKKNGTSKSIPQA